MRMVAHLLRRRFGALAVGLVAASPCWHSAGAEAQEAEVAEETGVVTPANAPEPLILDRVAVAFWAPELGGARAPQFVFERELAFEARLEALQDPAHPLDADRPYRRHHVQAALERHVAETLLAALRITPEPPDEVIETQMRAARVMLTERVGGALALQKAMRAEGIGTLELRNLLRRRARASLYLDRMVAPMLAPSEAELRKIHRTRRTPFQGKPYREIAPALRRWYVATRLGEAAVTYYKNARARLQLQYLPRSYPGGLRHTAPAVVQPKR